MTELEAVNILDQALDSPLGVKVESTDADALRRKLYVVRRTDPKYKVLTFRISPHNASELWLIKRPAPNA